MSKYEKMVACNRKSSADKIELAVILALRHRIVYLGIGAVQPCDDVLVFCL